MATCKDWMKKGNLEQFWNGDYLEKEEKEELEIHYNTNEREGNYKHGMKKKNKIKTIGTERCAKIEILYTKNIIIIIIIIIIT